MLCFQARRCRFESNFGKLIVGLLKACCDSKVILLNKAVNTGIASALNGNKRSVAWIGASRRQLDAM